MPHPIILAVGLFAVFIAVLAIVDLIGDTLAYRRETAKANARYRDLMREASGYERGNRARADLLAEAVLLRMRYEIDFE